MTVNFDKTLIRKELLLVDLDDTLIDTSGYKKLLFKFLSQNLLLPETTIRLQYNKIHKMTNQNGWIEKLLDNLSEISKVRRNKLVTDCIDIVKKMHINKPVLSYCINLKRHKVIFTQGDQRIQNAKIKYLKLGKYFDDIVIINGDKVKYLISKIKGDELDLKKKTFGCVEIVDDKTDLYQELVKYSWIKISDARIISTHNFQ